MGWACRSVRHGKFRPGGGAQRERRRGFWPDAEGMVDVPAGRCFGSGFLRVAKGLRNTRRTPGASCPSANVWGRDGRSFRGEPRAPIPAPIGRPWQRRPASGKGWVGWREDAVPAGDRGRGRWRGFSWEVFRLAAAGPASCLGAQVLRRQVGRHPQPVIPRPMRKRPKSPFF